MTSKKVWVTLATNDSYSLGALVLAQSLKKVNTKHDLVILITPSVTHAMRGTLQSVFSEVKEVNVLDSGDAENLRLLARPELGITFTKLHCWRLTQYEKCVFLDADTLVLQNCDELFDREELSAAPDVGWPDCFNSGVFVFKPSEETYQALVDFAVTHGSFDGGDQGLLNMYFSGWATSDSSKRLPVLYNLASAAIYSYLPAFKWFGKGVKIMHFIGNAKPWLQSFNSETRTVATDPTYSHVSNFLQYWWDLFCSDVHHGLSPEMTRLLLRNWLTPLKPALNYNPPRSSLPRIDPKYPFHDLIILDKKIVPEFEEHYQFTDPWEIEQIVENTGSYDDDTEVSSVIYIQHAEPADTVHQNDDGQGTAYLNTNLTDHFDYCTDGIHCGTPAQSICGDFSWEPSISKPEPCSTEPMHLVRNESGATEFYTDRDQIYVSECVSSCPSVAPSKHFLANSLKEVLPEDSEISHTNETAYAAGVASSLSQMKLEEPSPEQTAREDFLRRQNWEHGNIDYMGRDSFDNILSKITQTISQQSEPDPVPPVTTDASDVCASPVAAIPPDTDTPGVYSSPAAPTAAVPPVTATPVACIMPAAPTAAAPPATDAPVACSLHPAPIAATLPTSEAPVACSMITPPPATDAPVACSMLSAPIAAAPPASDASDACTAPVTPVTPAVPAAADAPVACSKLAASVAPASPASDAPVVSLAPAVPIVPASPTSADVPVSCPKPVAPPVVSHAPATPIVPPSPTSADMPVACPKPVAPTPPVVESVQAEVKSQAESESASQSASKSEASQKAPPSRQSSAQESQGKSGQKSGGKKK